jgi:hypothetical protein
MDLEVFVLFLPNKFAIAPLSLEWSLTVEDNAVCRAR